MFEFLKPVTASSETISTSKPQEGAPAGYTAWSAPPASVTPAPTQTAFVNKLPDAAVTKVVVRGVPMLKIYQSTLEACFKIMDAWAKAGVSRKVDADLLADMPSWTNLLNEDKRASLVSAVLGCSSGQVKSVWIEQIALWKSGKKPSSPSPGLLKIAKTPKILKPKTPTSPPVLVAETNPSPPTGSEEGMSTGSKLAVTGAVLGFVYMAVTR